MTFGEYAYGLLVVPILAKQKYFQKSSVRNIQKEI